MKCFHIEKPSLIFVGSNVNAICSENKKQSSLHRKVLMFFSHSFPYLVGKTLEDILDDIYKKVYNVTEGSGKL